MHSFFPLILSFEFDIVKSTIQLLPLFWPFLLPSKNFLPVSDSILSWHLSRRERKKEREKERKSKQWQSTTKEWKEKLFLSWSRWKEMKTDLEQNQNCEWMKSRRWRKRNKSRRKKQRQIVLKRGGKEGKETTGMIMDCDGKEDAEENTDEEERKKKILKKRGRRKEAFL